MKYILMVFDGMADEPVDELDGKTPMQVARTPYMEGLAQKSVVGSVRTVPEGMYPGSDVANMSVLGYDPRVYYRGRAAIEAASLGIPMNETDVAFRANLISTDGELMLDSSGGHISTREARELIAVVDEKLSGGPVKFYPGVSYRHIMVWREGSMHVKLAAPYKIINEKLDSYMPEGDGAEKLRSLIYDSYEILDNHPVNVRRKDEGHLPANMLWFWGEGTMPSIPNFTMEFGKTGACVAAVDLIRGLAKMVGLKVYDVPGATGYVDTNYLGKGEYTLRGLGERDFVWVHVEAADEAGHEKDIDKKIKAIEELDSKVLGTVLDGISRMEEPVRILLLPDHPTPIATGAHSPDPVPYLLYDSSKPEENSIPFDERAVYEGVNFVEEGHRMIRELFNG